MKPSLRPPLRSDLRVLGVDPGTHVLGWGLIAARGPSVRLLNFGVVRGGGGELPARLLRIHDGLAEVLRRARPDMIAVERVFVAKDPRATITLGEGRGVALLAAARAVQAVGGPFRARLGGRVGGGPPSPAPKGSARCFGGSPEAPAGAKGESPLPQRIVEITPAEVKKAVAGNGAATKAQVQRMVQLQLGMANPPHPSDAADALAIAICAALRRSVGEWFDPAHHKSEGGSTRLTTSRRVGASRPGRHAQTLRRSDAPTLHAGSLPADVLRRAFKR